MKRIPLGFAVVAVVAVAALHCGGESASRADDDIEAAPRATYDAAGKSTEQVVEDLRDAAKFYGPFGRARNGTFVLPANVSTVREALLEVMKQGGEWRRMTVADTVAIETDTLQNEAMPTLSDSAAVLTPDGANALVRFEIDRRASWLWGLSDADMSVLNDYDMDRAAATAVPVTRELSRRGYQFGVWSHEFDLQVLILVDLPHHVALGVDLTPCLAKRAWYQLSDPCGHDSFPKAGGSQ